MRSVLLSVSWMPDITVQLGLQPKPKVLSNPAGVRNRLGRPTPDLFVTPSRAQGPKGVCSSKQPGERLQGSDQKQGPEEGLQDGPQDAHQIHLRSRQVTSYSAGTETLAEAVFRTFLVGTTQQCEDLKPKMSKAPCILNSQVTPNNHWATKGSTKTT